ncbi:hypothetical protein DPM33_02360 [Mesorhizobium hawassense]|uniref:Propionyl-coenzyme A carboxylase alpha polypeptide n=1 Tax=Mesorhizobium hawassense TaxID=1209954 RepID=A0A330I6W3_9HYPH|nr:hypothetical protein DPM33_02360 [Mesorhizobium hawassense]
MKGSASLKLPISPLVGEMPGRAEGALRIAASQDQGSSPHECGERWLGEAETERGAPYEALSVRFAATSPRLWRGEEPKHR